MGYATGRSAEEEEEERGEKKGYVRGGKAGEKE